jgi:hypothetical protein
LVVCTLVMLNLDTIILYASVNCDAAKVFWCWSIKEFNQEENRENGLFSSPQESRDFKLISPEVILSENRSEFGFGLCLDFPTSCGIYSLCGWEVLRLQCLSVIIIGPGQISKISMNSVFPLSCLAALAATALTGCGEAAPQLIHVKGKVTFQGRLVPMGFVAINPDRKKGNDGPQGIARIQHGMFDTGAKGGLGAMPGAVKVVVSGYDGNKGNDPSGMGDPLFGLYEIEVEIGPEMEPLLIDVE